MFRLVEIARPGDYPESHPMIAMTESACQMMLDTLGEGRFSSNVPKFTEELRELGIVTIDTEESRGVLYENYLKNMDRLLQWKHKIDELDYRSYCQLEKVNLQASHTCFVATLSYRLDLLNAYLVELPQRRPGSPNYPLSPILSYILSTLSGVERAYRALYGKYESSAKGWDLLDSAIPADPPQSFPHYPPPPPSRFPLGAMRPI